jgi:elongation factor Ts
MAEITAQMVMELRQKTGAKMMDAKHALVESDGDFTKAVELLRERGQADSAKRAARATAEGAVFAAQNADHTAAALAEVNCETDFVAKNDLFKALGNELAAWMVVSGQETATDVAADQAAKITETISKTGENIQFKRGVAFATTDGVVESYIHLGGKIGVLVEVAGSTADDVRTLAKDLAMQVAAASPDFLTREDVPAETIEKEMEIYRQLARNEGKPEQFLDRIATGRLEKFFKDNCLVEQPFVKDPDKAVKDLVAAVGKQVGAELTVKRFVRYQLGQ